ncbi:MAG TPA: Uma2 family endonuclease [Candidatus Lustribacter sp.]|jgi:Uma2 family endonuclease|nr:Uma2 family endonuclease [Candidatus Lustribacter sp.]
MATREIVLPETNPETEWILDRPVQKVSPTRRHAILQGAMVEWLRTWARGRGEVGTEWRFRITPPGEITRPLVPDVAYVSYERLKPLSIADRELPPLAPDIVVEILSPDDRPADVNHKRDVYLAAGAATVLLVDPDQRTLEVFDADGTHHKYADSDTYTPERFPGLTLSLTGLFAELDIP